MSPKHVVLGLFVTASIMTIGAVPANADGQRKMLYGQDISDYQAGFDIGREAERHDMSFVMTKATEGEGLVSDTFADNWRAAEEAGVIRGAYHYAHPDQDPNAEADHFFRTVTAAGGVRDGDFLVLDIEERNGRSYDEISEWSQQFLRRMEDHLGTSDGLMVYTNRLFGAQLSGLSSYPLWVAEYGDPPTPGELDAPVGEWGDDWVMHQYSDETTPRNAVRMSEEEFRDLGYRERTWYRDFFGY